MATFKEISDADIKTTKSFLNQLVDVIQEDISGSNTRKSYQVFVTGGIGPGVTSSLFQTVFDQDFSLQTSNPIFDLTVGIFSGSTTVSDVSTGQDSTGKLLFPSYSLMMREKISNYRQFAQLLLGNADSQFTAPFSNAVDSDKIDNALFVGIKRLFARDKIKRESFAMKFYVSASHNPALPGNTTETRKPNLFQTSESGSAIFTDVGSSANLEVAFGGEVGNVVNSANTGQTVGLLFYQQGIGVFDMAKILAGGDHVSGTVDAMNALSPEGVGAGKTLIGSPDQGKSSNAYAKFIPDFMVSGSIDNIVNHIASCRFSSGSNTAMTFQNLTNINSTTDFLQSHSR